MELLAALVFLGLISWVVYLPLLFVNQYYIRKLCRYRGTDKKPGQACVICAYNDKCSRAKKSKEYLQFSYFRRVIPDRAKEIYDEAWSTEKSNSNKQNAPSVRFRSKEAK